MYKYIIKPFRDKHVISNSSGNLALTMVVALSFFALTSYSVNLLQNQLQQSKRIVYKSKLKAISDNIKSQILNEAAWNNTLQAPANQLSLQCIGDTAPSSGVKDSCAETIYYDGGGTFVVQPGKSENSLNAGNPYGLLKQVNSTISGGIEIYSAERDSGGAAQLYYNGLDGSSGGFTLNGQPCTGFNATAGSGSDSCPIRINIELRKRCAMVNGDPCGINSIDVVGSFVFNAKTLSFGSVNYDNVNFEVNRTKLIKLNDFSCLNMGGDYTNNNSSEVCALKVAEMQCADGNYIKGFSNGSPICEKL